MNRLWLLWDSSVGKKVIMAVTGLIMVAYLVTHVLANLLVFQGPAKINAYGVFLREVGAPVFSHEQVLWTVRIILLLSVLLHMVAAYQLTRRDWDGRPIHYATRKAVQQSFASRTMRWGGVIIALFVVYHLLDITTGTLNPHGVHGEVYANVVADFAPERWYVTLVYTLAVVAVGFHVRHGVWSALQTLGRSSGPYQMRYKAIALVFAVVLTAGFLAVPFAVQFGLVGVL